MPRLPSLDWERLLKPPRPTSRRWTVRFKKGVEYSFNPQRPLEPHGMAQMVRRWSARLGYRASVRTEGDVVTAVLQHRRDRGADVGPPDPAGKRKAG